MLLCHDVGCVLHCVCCHNRTVISVRIGNVDLAFEEDTDSHLGDCVRLCSFILVNLVDSDVVLAIAGGCELRHGVEWLLER